MSIQKNLLMPLSTSVEEKPRLEVAGFADANEDRWVEVRHSNRTAYVRYNSFASERASVLGALADQGVVLVSRADRTALTEGVVALSVFTPRVIFSRAGWCQGQFVTASGRVFCPRGAPRGVVAFKANKLKCSRKGNLAAWRREVAERLIGHPIPAFFVMAAFAAPMIELADRSDNFGFEIAGTGGKGKSTTQRIMASVAGPPVKDRGYMTTFLMTPVALEHSMQWHSDMPFIIDEANLYGSGNGGRADRTKMQEFAFAMASGTTKGRHDNPEQQAYRFLFVTSANEPFTELLQSTHQGIAHAANDRLMTIMVPEGDAGVFGALPTSYSSYRQFTLALETAIMSQHGTAMPHFLNKLVKARHEDEADLKANIWRKIGEFKAAVGVTDNNGSDARVAEAFGLVYAAGSFAQHHKVLPKGFDPLDYAIYCYQNYRGTVPLRQSLPDRLLAIAARPETISIDRKDLPSLSIQQMASAGAFIRMVKGERLLLMTLGFRDAMFPDWKALRGSAEFRRLVRVSEGGRGAGYRCKIRSDKASDWLCAFRLPDEAEGA